MRDSLSPTPSPPASASDVLETLLEPASDPRRVSALTLMRAGELTRDFVVFEACHLRIDHQADRGGEGRALAGFRQPFDAERPSDARLAGDDRAGELRHPGQL